MRDKFSGCLLGGAAGDALGYTVEFMQEKAIFSKFGAKGITAYVPVRGKARISDDTQMTLFTADALRMKGNPLENIARAYRDWLVTQREEYPARDAFTSPLMAVPELFAARAPGLTCMSAIEDGCCGTMAAPPNHSKGCGGVMRVAPCGLRFAPEQAAQVAAEAAALTHGHPLGYIPAAMLGYMVSRLVRSDDTVQMAAEKAMAYMQTMFAGEHYLEDFLNLMEKAMALAAQGGGDLENIHALGEGWVAEEALAIALYCAVRYEEDFDAAMIASVNHKGDSDSTGAICGNLLGAAKVTGIDSLKPDALLAPVVADGRNIVGQIPDGKAGESGSMG